MKLVLSVTFFIFFAICSIVCVKLVHSSLQEHKFIIQLIINIKSEVSNFPIIVIFFHSCVFEVVVSCVLCVRFFFHYCSFLWFTQIIVYITARMRSICCICFGNLHKQYCGDFKGWWLLVTLSCTQASKRIWPLAYSEGKHQLKSLNFVKNWLVLPLKVQIPVTFSSQNYHSYCTVIAKTFVVLAGGTLALILMAGCTCSYWLCKAKSKHYSLWSDHTRQDKPMSKHSGRYRCWSTKVVYRGCRNVDSNS